MWKISAGLMKPPHPLSHERTSRLVRLDLGVRTPSDENDETTTTFLVRTADRGAPREASRDVDGSRNTGRVPEGVVHANWNPRNRQVKANWNRPGNSNPKLGARPAIVVANAFNQVGCRVRCGRSLSIRQVLFRLAEDQRSFGNIGWIR